MSLDFLRDYCLVKAGVSEEMPFGPSTLVFKVQGKVFLLTDLDSRPVSFNFKCDPERGVQLREMHAAVRPGYHMNKKHWNTVLADGSVPSADLLSWIDDSYCLVVQQLPRKLQANLVEI